MSNTVLQTVKQDVEAIRDSLDDKEYRMAALRVASLLRILDDMLAHERQLTLQRNV